MDIYAAKPLIAGHNEPDSSWSIGPDHHAYHELIMVTAGELLVSIRGVTHRVPAGHVLLYPAGVDHREWNEVGNPMESYGIAFEWDADVSTMPLYVADRAGRINTMMRWLHEEWHAAQSPATQTARTTLFRAVLAEWIRLLSAQEHLLITRTRLYMRTHLAGPITLAELAAWAGLSKYHFLRQFRSLAGHTPMEELRLIRLQEAQRMLLTEHPTLKDIAARIGLANSYQVCRLFKHYFGITPGQMRRTLHGQQTRTTAQNAVAFTK